MRSSVANTRAFIVAAGSAALLLACSNDALGPGNAQIESVAVVPSTATVAVGADLALSAEVLAASGEVITGQRISWASEDPSIAEVSQSGVVTGRKVGSVLIAASARGKDAFARVTVNPTPVSAVRLSVANRSMMVGQTFQLTAEALDAGGQVLPGRPITWSTSAAAVATVTANGLVSAVSPGGAIISAASEGMSAVAAITVSSIPVASVVVAPLVADLVVGQTTQLNAQLKDATGAALTGRTVTWSTNSAQVATVTSEGLVTAISPGSATITATSEGRTATATVNVTPRPVSAVIVSPEQVSLFGGQIVQLSALVTDDRGQVLTGRPVSFSSSNSQVATVSSAGLVTAVAAGTATITASSEGATGTSTITVTPDPVATVDVTPSPTSIFVGSGTQLTATARNVDGEPLPGRPVTWSSGTPGLASVSSSGFVTGLVAGTALINATIDGKQGSATVTVRPIPVASVSVTPATATVNVGLTVTLNAIPRDASGNALTGRVVGWSTSAPAIATVSATGVVTGVAVGTATITASSEGQSGSATVTVTTATPAPVATVSVTPSSVTIVVGGTQTVTATPRDADGNALTGRTITWASANNSVATVNQSGVITGVAAGTTNVTATSEGKVGTVAVTVTLAPVATVSVTPSSVSLVVGGTQTVTATPRDAAGNALTGRTITWASANTNIATVNQSGLITAVGVGATTVTATSEGKVGTVTVNVAARVVTTISVAPTPVTVNVAWTTQLTATARDQIGNVMTGVSFTWTTSSASIATVSSSGLVTGVAVGTATITAGSGTVTGTAAVTVQLAPVDRIVVTPTNPTIKEGQTVQLTATLYDALNNVLTGRTVTWSSADPTKVSVTSTGLARGLKKGTVVITASSGGKSGTSTVKVED